MLNQFLRHGLGILVMLACLSPAMAQQNIDPLTRFLDGVFKRPMPAPAQNREVQPPSVPAQQAAPVSRPAAQAGQPAASRGQKDAKKNPPKKAAAPKKQPEPQLSQPQVQAQPLPKPETKPEEQAERQPGPSGPEITEQKPPAALEPEKPASEPPAQASVPATDQEALAALAAESPPLVSPPAPREPAREPAKAANVSPQQPASAPTPVIAKAPVTPTAPPVPSSPVAALDRVNAYFNGMDQMTAYFVQKNPNGQQAEGTLAVKRPGILQFVYAPPSTLEIVSDGRNVAIRDKRLGTNDVYPIGQTPLKFLLQEDVDLARDTRVRDVQVGRDGMVTVRFDDTATLGGTSKITLRFDAKANLLKQWTIVDGQGYETSVTLSDLNMVRRRDASASN